MKSFRQLVANFRNEYISRGISEKDVSRNPVEQFEKWFAEAVENKINEPNAFCLSSVSAEGKPSGRIMLLKGFDEKGFVFFTNYKSRKGDELAQNPYATMTFLWLELFRQVRIEGKVHKISFAESEDYFHSRPQGSQLGALASAQSRVLKNREELEVVVAGLEKEYKNKPVPCPEHWGGFCLVPENIEFWQGRASRLHDRILYTLQENRNWLIQRLAP